MRVLTHADMNQANGGILGRYFGGIRVAALDARAGGSVTGPARYFGWRVPHRSAP